MSSYYGGGFDEWLEDSFSTALTAAVGAGVALVGTGVAVGLYFKADRAPAVGVVEGLKRGVREHGERGEHRAAPIPA